MLRRSEVMVDGVRSVVLQGGPASSDEAIVFVHGNPGFSRDWEELLERVGEFSRCLAPDMPGFGQPINRTSSTTQWPDTPAILVVC